jgi:hypothetical protein
MYEEITPRNIIIVLMRTWGAYYLSFQSDNEGVDLILILAQIRT